jgi:hypothetical protein
MPTPPVDVVELERELYALRAEVEALRLPEDLARIAAYSDRCAEETSRKGTLEPCDKPATAVRLDAAHDGAPYPVCSYHDRAPMVPLAQLLRRTP